MSTPVGVRLVGGPSGRVLYVEPRGGGDGVLVPVSDEKAAEIRRLLARAEVERAPSEPSRSEEREERDAVDAEDSVGALDGVSDDEREALGDAITRLGERNAAESDGRNERNERNERDERNE